MTFRGTGIGWVTVCDVDQVHCDEFNAKFDGKLKTYRDYRKLFDELKPDVVTCDLLMPRMDGVEFVRRQMQRQPLPILILTASPQDAEGVLQALDADLVEMKRCRTRGFCCGAGGAQMFKEPEPGRKDINVERTEEALATGAETIAVACPFCMTMLSDGVKSKEKESAVKVKDLAELIAEAQGLNS